MDEGRQKQTIVWHKRELNGELVGSSQGLDQHNQWEEGFVRAERQQRSHSLRFGPKNIYLIVTGPHRSYAKICTDIPKAPLRATDPFICRWILEFDGEKNGLVVLDYNSSIQISPFVLHWMTEEFTPRISSKISFTMRQLTSLITEVRGRCPMMFLPKSMNAKLYTKTIPFQFASSVHNESHKSLST